MKLLLFSAILAAFPLQAIAENTLTERDREVLAAVQRLKQEQRARAQARCIEQRGADCVSDQGLQEWLLLDLTREDALLNRYGITVPSASSSGAGASAPSPSGGQPLPGQQR